MHNFTIFAYINRENMRDLIKIDPLSLSENVIDIIGK